MTPERGKALEAVAEVLMLVMPLAKGYAAQNPYRINREIIADAEAALIDYKALTALDALPAEPADAGEMVEVRAKVWRDPHGDTLNVTNEHAKMEQWWVPHCIITARIPRPVVPEVRADLHAARAALSAETP